MADDLDDDLDFQPAEAGTAFKAEMAATKFFNNYWKHLLALLIVGLIGILIYGQYTDYVQRTQRNFSAEVARSTEALPAPVALLPVTGDGVDKELAGKVADEILATSNKAWGVAKVEGLLKAAELFRLAEKPEQQKAALLAAVDNSSGLLNFAANGALANLELEAGEGESAVQRLRSMMGDSDAFLAQQAARDLGLALEHLGKVDEARQVYTDFKTKWPNSSLGLVIDQRLSALKAG